MKIERKLAENPIRRITLEDDALRDGGGLHIGVEHGTMHFWPVVDGVPRSGVYCTRNKDEVRMLIECLTEMVDQMGGE